MPSTPARMVSESGRDRREESVETTRKCSVMKMYKKNLTTCHAQARGELAPPQAPSQRLLHQQRRLHTVGIAWSIVCTYLSTRKKGGGGRRGKRTLSANPPIHIGAAHRRHASRNNEPPLRFAGCSQVLHEAFHSLCRPGRAQIRTALAASRASEDRTEACSVRRDGGDGA